MEEIVVKEFKIPSTTEVEEIAQQIKAFANEQVIIHILAYLHNTVLVQTLKKSLEEVFSPSQLRFLKQQEKKGATVVVYILTKECDSPLESYLLYTTMQNYQTIIDEYSTTKQQLIEKFFRDQLTTLPNVYQLRKDLESSQEVTLISITIDDFKAINSFYGFFVGDFVLEHVAKVLEQFVDYKLYKMPGGEFILMSEKAQSYYLLLEFIEEMYQVLLRTFVDYNGLSIYLDFTVVGCTSKTIEQLLAKLSIAYDYAKKNKLPFFIYEDTLGFLQDYKENIILSSKIKEAIQNDRIVAFYQPIIDNNTKKIVKYETLARLIDENNEVQSPNKFLDVAKKTKVYHLITKKMVQSAFATFKDQPYEFSINISKDDIINVETYSYIFETLKKDPHTASRVIFELLESDAMRESDKTIEFINEAKRYGAKIAIDDFGSGYSNFSMLMNLQVDILKIDGSLIRQIEESKNSYLVVESIVEFAKKLGIEVVAEHVFSSSVFAKLKALGVEYSQGFFIDKPRVDIKTQPTHLEN